jgi:glycosyltransferase involved in cell wall biosynthesis
MVVWNTLANDARVQNEAATLQAAGFQVVVHALHAPGETPRRERLPSGVNVVRHGGREGRRLVALQVGHQSRGRMTAVMVAAVRVWTHLAVLLSLLSSRPRAVHAHDLNVLPTAWLASRLLRVPLVYDAHEVSAGREGYRARRRWAAGLERWLMRRASASITTTGARARFFARAYGVPRPLVLQNRPRYVQSIASDRLRTELNLTMPWLIIVYQGGLQPGRGLEGLIDAMADVAGAYLVLVGGGSQAVQLREQVQDRGLSQRVHLIPTVPLAALPDYTASADIGVQPIENTCINHFTTDSNKLFEYINAGLPIVASALPEISRVVRDYDVGILVKPGSVEALAEALRTLVQDPQRHARLAANACNAAETLNWEDQEQSLVTLYRELGL